MVSLQDLVSGAASTTGLIDEGPALRMVRRLKRHAYRDAERVITISDAFSDQLLASGVPASKLERVYLGASLDVASAAERRTPAAPSS